MKKAIPPKMPYHTDDRYWSLVEDDSRASYLLVHVEHGFVGFPVLIKLNETDHRNYHALGWLALQYLANHINAFTSDYSHRTITGPRLDAAVKAAPQV